MANSEPINFFSDFEEDEILRFILNSDKRNLSKDQFVFKEGDNSAEFYIIISGEIEISAQDPTDKKIKLITLRSGSIIGEIGFIDGNNRNATAKVISDAQVLAYSKQAFAELEKNYPQIALKILKGLGKIVTSRLRMCGSNLVNHAMLKINENFLFNLKDKNFL
jgi:CRP-like cAMP-binding protein